MVSLQAAGEVSQRVNPAASYQLDASNGATMGRLAFAQLSLAAQNGEEQDVAARTALPLAQRAFQAEPVNPHALTVMIRAQEDDTTKRALLASALQLHRRSLALQGLALDQHGNDGDLPKVVETLDQILRVHPERFGELGPVLIGALVDDSTLPSFALILSNSSPWHKRFLNAAAANPNAVENLGKLIRQTAYRDEALDQIVIDRLGATGNIAEARIHLAWINEVQPQSAANAAQPWPIAYPPLDWRLREGRGRRAQLSRDGSEVEIFVRSGSGGELLSRSIAAPARSGVLRIEHNLEPADQIGALRLRLTCDNAAQPFLNASFADIGGGAALSGMPDGCEYLTISVSGRSLSGRPPVSGAIQSIKIS